MSHFVDLFKPYQLQFQLCSDKRFALWSCSLDTVLMDMNVMVILGFLFCDLFELFFFPGRNDHTTHISLNSKNWVQFILDFLRSNKGQTPKMILTFMPMMSV